MSFIWRAYTRYLTSHPWSTQCLMTGVLMSGGDVIAQLAVERKSLSEWDLVRTARFLGFGMCVAGPVIRTWYLFLDKRVSGTNAVRAMKMVAADQGLFAPVFLANFVGMMGILRRDSMEEIKEKYEKDYIPILQANYKLWPAVQIINFTFVPLQHRLLVVNTVALAWNTFLAWRSESETKMTSSTALTSSLDMTSISTTQNSS